MSLWFKGFGVEQKVNEHPHFYNYCIFFENLFIPTKEAATICQTDNFSIWQLIECQYYAILCLGFSIPHSCNDILIHFETCKLFRMQQLLLLKQHLITTVSEETTFCHSNKTAALLQHEQVGHNHLLK
jgi:hypothetical protein